jgi:sulfite reductase (NADPH) flavoprotein alpha-component
MSGLRRFANGTLGNLVVGLVLALIAFALLRWQKGALSWSDPGNERIAAALGVVALYLGCCALLWYRRRRAHRPVEKNTVVATAVIEQRSDEAPLLVVFASQTGFAEQLAGQTAQSLRAAGTAVSLRSMSDLDDATLAVTTRALFIVSTTGEGDAPDSAARFVRDMLEKELSLSQLRYGVLALGDSEYVNYCAFGHRVDQWLRHRGATALFDPVEVDNGDEGALRNWQHQLGLIAGSPDVADWQAPRYAHWRLAERRLLNPGSAGDPCFHLALEPAEPAALQWSAGDIAEIGPCNAPQEVAAVLAALALDATAAVEVDGRSEVLADVLARSYLPTIGESTGRSAQAIAAALKPLPHREYSIASIPSDGSIHLLLRQMRRPDGSLGIGGGWLTEYAPLGGDIALRVRTNSNFHAPPDARPLILIGNGTGLAGLRALLKQRVAAAQRRNWLVFGERNAGHDFYYRDEIESWQASGALELLDLAFSRDQAERVYVQQRLREAADALRSWVAQGAAIYVCGSLEGMAPGVDKVLRDVLSVAVLEQMTADARYRRDVY